MALCALHYHHTTREALAVGLACKTLPRHLFQCVKEEDLLKTAAGTGPGLPFPSSISLKKSMLVFMDSLTIYLPCLLLGERDGEETFNVIISELLRLYYNSSLSSYYCSFCL